MLKYLLVFLFSVFQSSQHAENFFYTQEGEVSFRSEAQQELIKASSNKLVGILDPEARTFIFKVSIRSFTGFNSALQQEHFNEKYLESEKYPEAYFNGKIIEDLDLRIDGMYDIRAKGKLNIHGVATERIIRSKVSVVNGKITIDSNFNITLSDHNIKIPKVVHEKIAKEIAVNLHAVMSVKE